MIEPPATLGGRAAIDRQRRPRSHDEVVRLMPAASGTVSVVMVTSLNVGAMISTFVTPAVVAGPPIPEGPGAVGKSGDLDRCRRTAGEIMGVGIGDGLEHAVDLRLRGAVGECDGELSGGLRERADGDARRRRCCRSMRGCPKAPKHVVRACAATPRERDGRAAVVAEAKVEAPKIGIEDLCCCVRTTAAPPQ